MDTGHIYIYDALLHEDDDNVVEEVESSSENSNRDYMLTTRDNPYDPWKQWDEWLAFDIEKGYGTCEYLARVAITSPDMTDEENSAEISRAIDEIIGYDVIGLYTRAYAPDDDG